MNRITQLVSTVFVSTIVPSGHHVIVSCRSPSERAVHRTSYHIYDCSYHASLFTILWCDVFNSWTFKFKILRCLRCSAWYELTYADVKSIHCTGMEITERTVERNEPKVRDIKMLCCVVLDTHIHAILCSYTCNFLCCITVCVRRDASCLKLYILQCCLYFNIMQFCIICNSTFMLTIQ